MGVASDRDTPGVDGLSYSISLEVNGKDIDKYPAKQHARRVASKLGRCTGLIYLIGQQTRLLEDSDQGRPFRQRRYFFYLSGAREADCHLTYDIGTDTLSLYVPDFDLRRAIWNGPTLGKEEAAEKYDVDEVHYYSALKGDVADWQHENGKDCPIFILHQDQPPPATTTSPSSHDNACLLRAMDACRVIKDEHEIKLIKRANDISSAAHTSVLQGIAKMANETEIHGTFLNTCVSHGAKNQAYEIIAASGANAATLHYVKNDEPLQGRQLVCLDAGAEWDCYASDVTRTFPMSDRWPSREARDIYRVVEEMQEECISRVREGVRYRDLHMLAHRIAIRALQLLGIFRKGSVDEILASGASSVFFPHGLGHHVGLEVHDVSPESIMAAAEASGNSEEEGGAPTNHDFTGGVSLCSESAPALKAGMVVTVEPGIYFSRLAIDDAKTKEMSKHIRMDVVETYMPVGGVRIEDDILVTKDGYKNLTTAAKGERMLEIIGRGH